MSDKGSARIWVLAVIAISLGGFGYYLYSKSDTEPVEELVEIEVSSVEEVEDLPEAHNGAVVHEALVF